MTIVCDRDLRVVEALPQYKPVLLDGPWSVRQPSGEFQLSVQQGLVVWLSVSLLMWAGIIQSARMILSSFG